MLALDEQLESEGHPVDDRVALLEGAWRLLPDVAREHPEAASSFRAEIQALVGPEGPPPRLLADWKERFPAPGSALARRRVR